MKSYIYDKNILGTNLPFAVIVDPNAQVHMITGYTQGVRTGLAESLIMSIPMAQALIWDLTTLTRWYESPLYKWAEKKTTIKYKYTK